MNNLDAIRSYLIELGANIDTDSIKKFNNTLDGIEKRVSGTFKRLGSFIKKAWLPALTVAIVGFTNSIAKSDLEIQKLAKRFFLTDESAKSLKRTLDAMGLDGIEDLQDVALNPELTKQYLELQKLAKELSTGSDVQNNLKEIRALSFEFTKLKLIVSYLFDRVASAIYEKGKPFFKAANQFMNDFNTKFKNNIDWVADKIGTAFSWVLRLAYRVKQVIGAIWGVVEKIAGFLNDDMKNLFKGALIGLIAFTNPIIALLALLDDFMTYKEGGNSAFEGIWEIFDDLPATFARWGAKLENWIRGLIDWGIKRVQDGLNLVKKTSSFFSDTGFAFENWIKQGLDSVAGVGKSMGMSIPQGLTPEGYMELQNAIRTEEAQKQLEQNTYNRSQNVVINVNGAGEPRLVAQNLASIIRNEDGAFG